MGDLTTTTERAGTTPPTFTVPSLRLPRFELGQVVVDRPPPPPRPAPPAPSTHHAAPRIAQPEPVQFLPYAAPGTHAASQERLARLRTDAMLGLVLGIAAAVVAASFILAMWASMHGDPPGIH